MSREREREISGSEAARLQTEHVRERRDGLTATLRRSMQEADARFAGAERECVQLRAERDQALELLRQVRATMEPVTEDAIQFLPEEDGKRYTFAAGFNSAAFAVRQHIDQSGLLDDEGQQR